MCRDRVARVSPVVVQRRWAATALWVCWTVATLCASSAPVMAARGGEERSPDQKAATIEQQMTDEERFSLLHGLLAIPYPGPASAPHGLPVTAGYVPGVPRLNVPALLETDASLGVVNPLQLRPDYSTALPAGLSLAATFDTGLAFRSGAAIGNEARGKGFNVLLAGGVNLARDPRNGRNFEYLGEDPLLAGSMAGASVRGIQSEHVISTVKHFALNDQETQRNSVDVRIPEQDARESDLLAFQLAIEQGQPGAVMCAYNKVAGVQACGSDFLLNNVLKADWRFPGWVMSDWGAVHSSGYFSAGLDQESGQQLDEQVWFDEPLKKEVAAGRVSRARLSEAVRRILRSIYAVGADSPSSAQPIDYSAHEKIAREVAGAGIVLLKNESDLLPISASVRSIAVIGGHAESGVLSGGGSSQVTPRGPITIVPVGGDGPIAAIFNRLVLMSPSPVAALRAALPAAKVTFDSGYVPESAAAIARHAEMAIVFATQWQTEAADGSLTLPQGQDALIETVAAANPNTIVVLETGNPVKMPWLGRVKAVMEAWYPGSQGADAIAQVLTGSLNPSGRLPISFPVDETQLPHAEIPGLGLPDRTEVTIDYSEGADVGYRRYAAKGLHPLFAFGYGLSYTTFEHTDLRVKGGITPTIALTSPKCGTEGRERCAADLSDESRGNAHAQTGGLRSR